VVLSTGKAELGVCVIKARVNRRWGFLKTDETNSFETLVHVYQGTQNYTLENFDLNIFLRENLYVI
jgi:hypothetical protein